MAILALLCSAQVLGTDPRMRVEILPDEENGQIQVLRADIKKAVEVALPMLWNRLIPMHVRNAIPEDVRGLGLLLRASPTADGIRITFNRSRVFQYLKKQQIPYIETPPGFNVTVYMHNLSGISMPQSAALLVSYADEEATHWGYQLKERAPALVLSWRWLDQQQVSLSVRGNSRLPEFVETKVLEAGDPLPQMQDWLLEVMLKARDAYASDAAIAVSADAVADTEEGVPTAQDGLEVMLTLQRNVALPEQVLLEDALRRNPRVAALVPYLLSSEVQQYRLILKSADDSWLAGWFARNGMQLSPRPDGWLAQ
ncbi:MAG: hypothetical protein ACE5F3_06290 [Mariprofundaceae bacterium]